ncbi:MAG: hypothetical protein EP343_26920 [Deltaproteobacteria bacterium]|nr:MAG: hypothetical protein EP343_26920 [Deltaproteobacteria bacterium]
MEPNKKRRTKGWILGSIGFLAVLITYIATEGALETSSDYAEAYLDDGYAWLALAGVSLIAVALFYLGGHRIQDRNPELPEGEKPTQHPSPFVDHRP